MVSSTSPVLVKVHPPSGTIVLNRPERRNALTRRLLGDLVVALDDLYHDKRVRAIILTGSAPAFCAGMDLGEMRSTAALPDAEQRWGEDAAHYREIIQKMLAITKPIIAAVNGPAVAGGGGLLLASDVVIATESAQFGFPEPRRGIVAGIVGPLLSFRIGAGQAARLLLTSSLIEAAEAYRIGVYHELVAESVLWARAQEIATEIAAGAPQAIHLTKRLINDTIAEHLATQLASGAIASATARTTEAAAEGLQAFLEQRPPQWE